MRATIIDIRNRTGLSLATISKYLNGGNVRPENKAKIDEAVEALHYRVNETARSLVTRNTHTIGVVVFSIENLFSGIMLRHIGDYFRALGYGMLICDSSNDPEVEAENLKSMIQKNVDGIILMPVSGSSDLIPVVIHTGIPLVCLDRKTDTDTVDSVTIDNRAAARSLTELLIDAGHTDIAFLGSSHEYTGYERMLGFREAMNAAGRRITPEWEYLDHLSLPTGYNGMKAFLAMPHRPTAVLLSNYEITLGAVMAIHESSFSYPEDISIAAVDNLILSDIVIPRITTAIQPMQEMARAASELLLQRIQAPAGEQPPCRDIVFPAEIRAYESIRRMDKSL